MFLVSVSIKLKLKKKVFDVIEKKKKIFLFHILHMFFFFYFAQLDCKFLVLSFALFVHLLLFKFLKLYAYIFVVYKGICMYACIMYNRPKKLIFILTLFNEAEKRLRMQFSCIPASA